LSHIHCSCYHICWHHSILLPSIQFIREWKFCPSLLEVFFDPLAQQFCAGHLSWWYHNMVPCEEPFRMQLFQVIIERLIH
jgi:hypothetical protein